MKSTHLSGKFTHPFLQSYWNFTFKFKLIIYIKIYAVLLLAKLVAIYAFLVCKIFGPKVWSCKIFDKFQVWYFLEKLKDNQSLEQAVPYRSPNHCITYQHCKPIQVRAPKCVNPYRPYSPQTIFIRHKSNHCLVVSVTN